MQLDLVEWIAYQDDVPGALPPPASGARVHNEHSMLSTLTAHDASCVHSEHTANVRPMRPMSPHRLLVCLAVLGWSERELARRTGRHQTTIKRWTGGGGAVDGDTAAWLEQLVSFHLAHPAPRRGAGLPASC
jgi:hypothetical protein